METNLSTQSSQGAPLLATKLYIPRTPLNMIARPRLIERLNKDIWQRRLTLISAPAGFGKTTLLTEWLAGGIETETLRLDASDSNKPPTATPQALKIAWVSLDARDNDPVRFLSYLVAALRGVEGLGQSVSGIGAGVLEALRAPGIGKAKAFSQMEAPLTALVNQINALPFHIVLVLDDYHLITNQPIHDALDFLLDHLPDNLHLVIASRSDPPLPLARLRGRGQLTELRLINLRFTPDEIARFLDQVAELDLSADDIAALTSRTEGWIAGLQMAALAIQGYVSRATISDRGGDAASFIQSFSGSNRYILDYLAEEVLQRQPDDIQVFLLQTAILERMSAPLCDAVCGASPRDYGRGDGQSTLEMLERTNLFVVPLDDERRWYRYHRLFGDLLRKRLDRVYANRVPTLHRRASEWYEENGLIAEAIEHALAAKDVERAAGLIEGAAEATLMRSEVATLLNWVEALPDDTVCARPLLCVFHAGALLLSGRPLDAVEERLRDATRSGTNQQVAGELAAFRALIATLQGDARCSADLSRRALELLPRERPFLRSIVADNLGIAYVMTGDIEAAVKALDEAVKMGKKVGNVMSAVGALSNVAGLAMMQGQLSRAAEIYQRALKLATDEQGRRLPVAGKALMGLGELSREWNDLETATRYLTEGVELTRQYAEFGVVVGFLSLARIRQAQADEQGARDMIQKAKEVAVEFDASEMDDVLVETQQVRLWIEGGDLDRATRWAQERGLIRVVGAHAAGPANRNGYLHLALRDLERATLARLYLAEGRADDAVEVLGQLLPAAERLGQLRRVIEVLLLQALAFWTQGDTEDALAALSRALSLGEPGGYTRVFLDEGEPMARLLYQAALRGIAPEYAGRLLAAFEFEVQGDTDSDDYIRTIRRRKTKERVASSVVHTNSLVESLSDRELEVLQLIAEGMSNREIAERLVISLSTVKGHNSNIYSKLGVNSRMQAVTKARALGIWPDL